MLYLVKYYNNGKEIEALDQLANVQTSFIKKAIDKVKQECLKIDVKFNELTIYSIEGGLV